MLTQIKISNYKSLVNFEADLKIKNQPNSAVIIYGANGAGKTNFLSSIHAISAQTKSLTHMKKIIRIVDGEDIPQRFRSNIMNDLSTDTTIDGLLSKALTIGETEGSISVSAIINNREAIYEIKFNKKGLIFERLYYVINENRGELFKISYDNGIRTDEISPQVYSSKLRSDIPNLLDQYWGKHSLLSIFDNLISESNPEFIVNNINKNILSVLAYFGSIYTKNVSGEQKSVSKSPSIFKNIQFELEEGYLQETPENMKYLKLSEEMLFDYLNPLFPNIIDVSYDISKEKSRMHYSLVIVKIISNNITRIPIVSESSGTKNLIRLLPYIAQYLRGDVVLIDEIETATHDLAAKEIFNSVISATCTGQLIATTHNTMLMEELDSENIYILSDDGSEKRLDSVSSYSDSRIREGSNIRKRYLSGLYSGIPFSREIDFELIKDILNEEV